MTSSQDIESRLIHIVRKLLQESDEGYRERKISLELSLQRHLGMDSLMRAELSRRVEKEFRIHISERLIAQAETLQDIALAIKTASSIEPGLAIPITQYRKHVVGQPADVSQAKTLIEVLMAHTEKVPEQAHIYYLKEDGSEEIITYRKLLSSSVQIAHAFLRRNLEPYDTVAIMLPTGPEFFYTFFGVLLANGIPVPIYPPFRLRQLEAYVEQEARILQNAEARFLVTFAEAEALSRSLRSFVPSLKEVTTVEALFKSKDDTRISLSSKGEDPALIQYTSGSTSHPKGVLLTNSNLLSNIRAFGEAVQFSASDIVVSWLPLYHDLGLIGNWLGSLYHGAPLVLLSPLTFLTRPEKWLWTIHYHRATLSAGPNFAYELCVRKIDAAMVEGLDLSSWRLAVNGAEAVYPKTLKEFTEKFSRYGFKAEAFCPVYGLAESTVGLAIPPLHRVPWIDVIDRNIFEAEGRAVSVSGRGEKETAEFVSCGKPITGHEIRIVDEGNQEISDRHVGYLQFRGPSCMQGYFHNPEATSEVFHDGWLDSGDLAYKADGEIFIVGRKKDVIIKAGRHLFPAEMEELTAEVSGVRRGCVVAFGIIDIKEGTEKLVVVAETAIKNKEEQAKLLDRISEQIASRLDIIPDHIVLVSPRTVPKTSSGKLQRSLCKKMYLEGKLTKYHVPVWLQVIRFSMNTMLTKLYRGIINFVKLLYTIYIALFAVIGALLIWIIFKFISPEKAAKISQMMARTFCAVGFCPIQIQGRDNLYAAKPVIFVSNHASYVDSIILTGLLPIGTRFIGKKELFSRRILRDILCKLKHLPVDRLDFSQGLEDTRNIENALKGGDSVLIFPEGTFSYAPGLRPFKPGAFKIAGDTQIPICPIAIFGTRRILRGGSFLLQPGRIKITVGEPIYPHGHEWQDIMNLKKQSSDFILKYCGEPSLDYIAAQTIGLDKPPE